MQVAIQNFKQQQQAFARVPQYQKIIGKLYLGSLTDLQRIGNDILEHALQYPEQSVERLASMIWTVVAQEFSGILDDLYAETDMMIYKRQRGYYATLRFCMEAVADFVRMIESPQALQTFYVEGEKINERLQEIRQQEHNEQTDRKIASILQQGKMGGCISKRISRTLPGFLQDYAMFCLYTHPSLEGLKLFYAPDTLDLLYHKTSVLAKEILTQLFVMNERLGLTSLESGKRFEKIYKLLIDNDRRVINLHYGKDDADFYIKKETTDELYQNFCNRSTKPA